MGAMLVLFTGAAPPDQQRRLARREPLRDARRDLRIDLRDERRAISISDYENLPTRWDWPAFSDWIKCSCTPLTPIISSSYPALAATYRTCPTPAHTRLAHSATTGLSLFQDTTAATTPALFSRRHFYPLSRNESPTLPSDRVGLRCPSFNSRGRIHG